MEKLLIIDSNSIMNRAFFGMPQMITTQGLHTNAVLGYLNILNKIREEIKPDYVVATFDMPGGSFRSKQFTDYKGTRGAMAEELRQQMPIIKEVLTAMSISIFGIEGFEADDLIGTLSLEAEKEGIECFILSGDKDTLQLASKMTKVIITKKGVSDKAIYDEEAFIEEYGITPTQFIDVKGLMGDKSDNIPGVPSVGEKTAFSLIKEYGSMENLYNHVEEITRKKLKENLVENKEIAVLSKSLATIKRDVPMDLDFDEIKSRDNYDVNKLKELYLKLQFRTLLNKLNDEIEKGAVKESNANMDLTLGDIEVKNEGDSKAPIIEAKEEINRILVKDIKSLKDLNEKVKESSDNILVSFSYIEDLMLSKREIDTIYLSLGEENYIIEFNNIIKDNDSHDYFKNIFQDNSNRILGYNVKNAYTIMKKHGIHFSHVEFDVLLATYLIEPNRGQYPLKDLIFTYLMVDIKGEGDNLKILENRYIGDLYTYLKEELNKADLNYLYYDVELPLTNILSDMELTGMRVDKKVLEDMKEKFQEEITKVSEEIYKLAGEEFNISSPKQLGVILFEKLDLPPQKKTKTGYSTNQEVLDILMDKHPIIEKVVYYRQITKIFSTYVVGLLAAIDVDDAIHSNFQQTLAVTGRLSSTEPNLQNIPIKYEMGRELRKAFIPLEDSSYILSSDYSQIELRVLAHMANDKNMIDAFINNVDIHRLTASEVLNIKPEEVSDKDRSNAKAVNFGIVYGISDFALSQDLKITRNEAKEYIERYYNRYPNIRNYFEETKKFARENGMVLTMFNRRRQIPEINATNKIVQAQGVRLAMNSPIQGSAADIMKIAMVKVYNALIREKLESRIILQVHDEILINAKENELEKVKKLVNDEMEQAIKMSVTLKSDQNIGKNWYEAK